jgi:hypothetical protein
MQGGRNLNNDKAAKSLPGKQLPSPTIHDQKKRYGIGVRPRAT